MPSSSAKLLREFRAHMAIHNREPIANRLESLFANYHDDYGRGMNPESLQTFMALFSRYPMLKKPLITAAENGNLIAEWTAEDKKGFLSLQCLPHSNLSFLAIYREPRNPRLDNQISGTTTLNNLFNVLSRCFSLNWLYNPEW